jgi:methyltransferase-like protein
LLPLSAVDRYLLPLLDGHRDRQALVEALMDVVGQDLIRIDRDDGKCWTKKASAMCSRSRSTRYLNVCRK